MNESWFGLSSDLKKVWKKNNTTARNSQFTKDLLCMGHIWIYYCYFGMREFCASFDSVKSMCFTRHNILHCINAYRKGKKILFPCACAVLLIVFSFSFLLVSMDANVVTFSVSKKDLPRCLLCRLGPLDSSKRLEQWCIGRTVWKCWQWPNVLAGRREWRSTDGCSRQWRSYQTKWLPRVPVHYKTKKFSEQKWG